VFVTWDEGEGGTAVQCATDTADGAGSAGRPPSRPWPRPSAC